MLYIRNTVSNDIVFTYRTKENHLIPKDSIREDSSLPDSGYLNR